MSSRSLLPTVFLACFAAVAVADDSPDSFTGRVVDRAGNGVPNAAVVMHWRHLDGWDVHRAETDADGRFTIDRLPAGRFEIYARSPDGRVGLAWSVCIDDPPAGEIEITIVEPRTLRMKVAGPDGLPLKGAGAHTVDLTGPNGKFVLRPLNIKAFGLDWPLSDENGLLEVGGLPAVEGMIVEVAHPALVRSEPVEVPPDAAEPPTVSLTRGGVFVISIRRDGADIPEEGLRLDLFGERRYFVNEPFAESDRDGRYRFNVPFGTWSGLVRGDGVQTLPAAFENVVVAEGAPGSVEITLTPRGIVRGRVVEQETGEPAANEVVSAAVHSDEHDGDPYGWGAGWFHSAHAITDDEGRFEITPGVGKVRLRARATDRGRMSEPAKIELDVPRDRPVEVEPFQLLPPARVTGIVLDPAGNPVPEAVVKPTGDQRYEVATVADEDGRFDFAVKGIDRAEPESSVGSLSLRVFDPHRPLEATVTVPVDLRENGEAVTVRLKQSPIASSPGVIESDPQYVTVRVGEIAPELAGRQTLNGDGPIHLADLRGKYVLLDFWTVWCGPCRRMKPAVEAAARLYGDRLVVIGVHDNSVAPEAIAAEVRENGPSFPTLVDTVDDETLRRYGVAAYPTYVLIGPDGRVLLTSRHNGEAMYFDLLATLRSFLHGPPRHRPVEAVRP